METLGEDNSFNLYEQINEIPPLLKEFLGDLSVDAENLEKMFKQSMFLKKQYESEDAQDLLGLCNGGVVFQDIIFAFSYFNFVLETMKVAFEAAKTYDVKLIAFLKMNPQFEEHLRGVKKESMCNFLVMARNAETVRHVVEIWRKCVGYMNGVTEILEDVKSCVSEMEYMYEIHKEMLQGSRAMYKDVFNLISKAQTTLIPPAIFHLQVKQLRSHQTLESCMLAMCQWKQIWRMLSQGMCIPFYQLRDLQGDLVQSEVTRHYWARMIERHNTSQPFNPEVYAVEDVVDTPVAVSFTELRGKAQAQDIE